MMKTELENLKKEINERIDRLLKPDYEVGKWYYADGSAARNYIILYEGKDGFGSILAKVFITTGNEEWCSYGGAFDRITRPLTPSEIEEALKKEAIKRGFKEGVTIRPVRYPASTWCIENNTYQYFIDEDLLMCGTNSVYHAGKWAEIVEQPITIGGYEVEFKCGLAGFNNSYRSKDFWTAAKTVAGEFESSVKMYGVTVHLETINKILARL